MTCTCNYVRFVARAAHARARRNFNDVIKLKDSATALARGRTGFFTLAIISIQIW